MRIKSELTFRRNSEQKYIELLKRLLKMIPFELKNWNFQFP